jgi:O-antigen/teichoic acid export membrane protein
MKKNTLNLIIFNLINSSTQFLVLIILSRYCALNDYATYRQVFLPFEVLAPLIGLGLSSSIFYFYPRYLNKIKLLFNSMLIIFLTSLLFEILMIFGFNYLISTFLNNDSIKQFLFYTGIFSFFSLSNTVLFSFLILEDKTKTNIIINFISNLIQLILLLIIVSYYNNLENIIILRVIVYMFSFLLLCNKTGVFKNFKINMINVFEECKEIIKYSYPLSFSLMIGVVSYQLDKVIVSSFCTKEQFAIYVNGAFEIPLIAIVTSSLAGASFGMFTNYCKEGDFEKANILFKKVTTISALIIFPSFVYLFLYAKEFVIFVFGKTYTDSYIVLRVYLLLLPIRIIQYGNILIALGKSKVLMKRSVIELIINLILSILLFKFIGYLGVALGTVISVLFWTVPFNLLLISKGFDTKLKLIIPLHKLGFITISSLFSIIITFLLDYLVNFQLVNKIIFFIITLVIYGLFYFTFIYYFKIISFDSKSKLKFKLN